MTEIEELNFIKSRLVFTTPKNDLEGLDKQKFEDPTTQLVQRFYKLYEVQARGRLDTLLCCMAIPAGKGDIAQLKIIDQKTLDDSLKALKPIDARIEQYENAIRSLDSISSDFIFEITEPAKAKQIREILKSLEVNKNVI